MVPRIVSIALVSSLSFGCVHTKEHVEPIVHYVAPYQQSLSQNFDWSTVKRVVLMPLANQTAYSKVSDELFSNFAAELQNAGRFDIVVATREDPEVRARDVFRSGEFNEIELVRVAREYGAQAVIFGNVTQYHPYSPPRVGLQLLIVSPAEGVVIGTVDGLWDARESRTATQAKEYFKRTKNWPKSLIDVDRAIESPEAFQRFVCEQIATSLNPSSGGLANSQLAPQSTVVPVHQTAPAATGIQELGEIPPVPPSSMSFP